MTPPTPVPPRIANKFLVVAQHAALLSPGHATPLPPGHPNHSAFSRLSSLPALTLRNARVAQALLPVGFFVLPLRISKTNARHDKESKLDRSGGSKQINPRAQRAFLQAPAFLAQYPPATRTHPADGYTR